jgi:hypothetical protein
MSVGSPLANHTHITKTSFLFESILNVSICLLIELFDLKNLFLMCIILIIKLLYLSVLYMINFFHKLCHGLLKTLLKNLPVEASIIV